MVLVVLRALFILLMAAVGWFYVQNPQQPFGELTWMAMAIALTLGTLLVCVDILSPRRKLAIFSGTIGGLIVGVSVAYALSFVVSLLVDQYTQLDPSAVNFAARKATRDAMVGYIDMLIGVACCYLSISFILQTKDDFRFVIPYVEFSKQTKGARPILLDTSVLIDGRIADIALTGVLESQLIVPRFVLNELQAVADSGDAMKRKRGRRGLDVLSKLQNIKRSEVVMYETTAHGEPENTGVDHQLMALAKELNARVLTNDFNLNKVAQLRGVDVININDLAGALRPVVLPGEKMTVRIQKPGEEAGQGVGFLEDGTMVVVEQGRAFVDREIEFVVTNTRQTSAGRMIFGRASDANGHTTTPSPGQASDKSASASSAGTPERTPPMGRTLKSRSRPDVA